MQTAVNRSYSYRNDETPSMLLCLRLKRECVTLLSTIFPLVITLLKDITVCIGVIEHSLEMLPMTYSTGLSNGNSYIVTVKTNSKVLSIDTPSPPMGTIPRTNRSRKGFLSPVRVFSITFPWFPKRS